MDRTNIYYLHYGDNVPIYVGKTVRIQGRMGAHRSKFGQNIILEVVDDVLTSEWKFWESYWIEQFKQWGFKLKNKNNGGGGMTHFISSPERGLKISIANKGRTMAHKGKPFTEEHKQKIKATREFLKSRPNTWQSLPVVQYDLSGNFIRNFVSQKEASIFMGIKGDGVGACCRGKQKSAYGYVWKFKNKEKIK
jgi:hypothetical protein